VTIRWHDYRAASAMFDGVIPPGTRATIDCDVVTGVNEENADEWLENEWKRKDAVLSRR